MMKRKLRTTVILLMALILPLFLMPTEAQATYTAPVSVVRIGLYTTDSSGSFSVKSLPSANLQNVTGLGSGYEFGYYDENRKFVSLGAETDTVKITMLMDKNMVYDSSSNSYTEGTSGSVVVGCYHIRFSGAYSDYKTAKAAADRYSAQGAFVRYEKSGFYVLVGEYTSASAASTAATKLGITGGYSIDSGTSYTVCVVATGTNKILFEFDCGTSLNLAVHPKTSAGVKAQTWFKYYKYYGDFVYWRNTGGNLTVINYVDVEDYVKGVVCYEMSPSWPIEALKAQAVTARTYLMANLNKHKTLGYDLCNSTECQAYHGTGDGSNGPNANSDAAVDQTAGQYLTYNGQLCTTFYYASNGGASENCENVWVAKYDYLKGVVDPYEAAVNISGYNYTVTYTGKTLAERLTARGYACTQIVKAEITFTDVGNAYSITFTDISGTAYTISKETLKSVVGARSQHFTINGLTPGGSGTYYVNDSADTLTGSLSGLYAIGSGGTAQISGGDVYAISGSGTVTKVEGSTNNSTGPNASGQFVITGAGNGHNVGMSQWGAYSMAKYYDKNYIDILTFYYTGTKVVTSA